MLIVRVSLVTVDLCQNATPRTSANACWSLLVVLTQIVATAVSRATQQPAATDTASAMPTRVLCGFIRLFYKEALCLYLYIFFLILYFYWNGWYNIYFYWITIKKWFNSLNFLAYFFFKWISVFHLTDLHCNIVTSSKEELIRYQWNYCRIDTDDTLLL